MTKSKLSKLLQRVVKNFMLPPKVKTRSNVKWTDQNSKNFTPEFFAFLFIELDKHFYKPEVEITSANDSTHSSNSTHYNDLAFDLETKDLVTKYCRYTIGTKPHNQALIDFSIGLANELENYFIIAHVTDSKNHIHLQRSRRNLKNPFGGNDKIWRDRHVASKEALPKYNNLYIL